MKLCLEAAGSSVKYCQLKQTASRARYEATLCLSARRPLPGQVGLLLTVLVLRPILHRTTGQPQFQTARLTSAADSDFSLKASTKRNRRLASEPVPGNRGTAFPCRLKATVPSRRSRWSNL